MAVLTVTACLALCLALGAGRAAADRSASAIVPPPGTPDLSAMMLQPSDFTPTARVTGQGYFRPDRELGEIAAYESSLVGGTAASGAKFAYAYSEVVLYEDSFAAGLYLGAYESYWRSPGFRQGFAHELEQAVRSREHARLRNLHFGALRRLHVGDDSILQPISARVRGRPYSYDRIAMRVDCAVASLELRAVAGGRISFGEALGLAGNVADRMRSGLRTAAPTLLVGPTVEVVPNTAGLPNAIEAAKVIEKASPGDTLSTTEGTWSSCPTSFTYQWERCDAMGAHCAPVGPAVAEVTARFYPLTAADFGMRLRVSVTAKNAVGTSAPATSAPSAVIQRRRSSS
ncbi:MAG TPA: hypothetical protein VKG38_20330 [Solirubrobacteraceae bacterium]|nr:hypothetical protein [Solirubrobacteraceae bacterium]